jgi:hypothetical protein
MPKSPNDYATSEQAVTDALEPNYSLINTPHPPNGGVYPSFLPDYHPKPFAGVARFFRWTGAPQWETQNPSAMSLLKIGLSNPVGNIYQATPTGRQIPLSSFAPNPFRRWRESSAGYVVSQPPEINQAGETAYAELANSIVRRR